jgi:hypothetical protein
MTKPIKAGEQGLKPHFKVRVVLPCVILHLASWTRPRVIDVDENRWQGDWVDDPLYGDTIGYIDWRALVGASEPLRRPTLPAYRTSDGSVAVWCAHCQRWHWHGGCTNKCTQARWPLSSGAAFAAPEPEREPANVRHVDAYECRAGDHTYGSGRDDYGMPCLSALRARNRRGDQVTNTNRGCRKGAAPTAIMTLS